MSTSGIKALREQAIAAKEYFTQRKQTIRAWKFDQDKVNIDISRSSSAQAKYGQKVKVSQAKAGDLVFFTGTGKNKISHVAMVVSNNKNGLVVVHSTTSKGVRKDNITHSKYWKPKVLFARQLVD